MKQTKHRLRGVEQLEPRQMLTVSVLAALPDLSVLVNATPQSIAVDARYDNPDVTGTVVRFTTNQSGSNNLIYTELFDQAGPSRTRTTPLTAANFLAYANAGRYTNTIIHRSIANFMIQGGGFTQPTAASNVPAGYPATIAQFAAVQNEFGNSNIRGTIAMAKLGNDPNSATNQWFFNTADNSGNLDSQNGGFTAFGRVLGTGMGVVDALAAIPKYNADGGGVFSDLPLRVPNLNTAWQPSAYVVFPSIAAVKELNYTATTTNAALVSPSFDSTGKLVLTYGAGVGTATVTVRASSVFNADDFVDDSFSVAVRGVPTAPAIASVVAGNAQLAVSWAAPVSTGGSPITEYVVKYSSNGGSTWTTFVRPASTALACTVTGLTNGTPYVFKVVAKNAVGISLPSANSAPATPAATVPGSPTSVVAVSGNAQLAVTWTAPASTGGSNITDYLVKYSSNGGSTWATFTDPVSTATACTVTGLTNGTAYVIKVIAKNAVGSSLPSANSAPATPAATVPGSPTSVVAVSGNAQLAVTWTAPASTGGSPITDYLVKYSSNSGVTWTTFIRPASTATACTVTGLTNGLPYVFKVIARNAAGISLPSATSLAVTPALPP
ncbi:MAG: fibronectin type III domain-containing protein, partial [Planctomycetota bacterium]